MEPNAPTVPFRISRCAGLPRNNLVVRLLRVTAPRGGGAACTAVGVSPLAAPGAPAPPLAVHVTEPRLPAAFSGACFAQLSDNGAWLLLHSPAGVAVVELPAGGGGGGGSAGAPAPPDLVGSMVGLPGAGGPHGPTSAGPKTLNSAR